MIVCARLTPVFLCNVLQFPQPIQLQQLLHQQQEHLLPCRSRMVAWKVKHFWKEMCFPNKGA